MYIASNFCEQFVREVPDKKLHIITSISVIADLLSILGLFGTSLDGNAKFWLTIVMIITSIIVLKALSVPSKNSEIVHSLKANSLISKIAGLVDRKRIGYWFRRINDKILFFKLWSKCPACHSIGVNSDCYLGIGDSLDGVRVKKSNGSLGKYVQEEQWICCTNPNSHRFPFDVAVFAL